MDVLVTGGAGYIGSTICSALKDRGHIPIVLDSLITGNARFAKINSFFEGDISDYKVLSEIKKQFPNCNTIIHCAARIIVSESVENPGLYYTENVSKSISLIENMINLGFKNLLFSSSASIYGVTDTTGVTEDAPAAPASPYATTNAMVETVIRDFCTYKGLCGLSLRYFNPIGADPKFRTGPFIDDPSHLLGRLVHTVLNKSKPFVIYGEDWPTRDGSCIRDYIHVWDLANAHVNGAEHLESLEFSKGYYDAINLGTGRGTTVKEFVAEFKKVHGDDFPVFVGEPRPGDVVGSYAVVDKAARILNWTAQLSLESGIRDALTWKKEFNKC